VEHDRLIIEIRGRALARLDVGAMAADFCRLYVGTEQNVTIRALGISHGLGRS
jgi:hypothetical protein